MNIRKANINDINIILDLDFHFTSEYKNFEKIQDVSWSKKFWKKYYENLILNEENFDVILADIDWKIVWYMEVEHNYIEEEFRKEIISKIIEFYVIKEYRDKWIGSKLFDFFQKEAKSKWSTMISIYTNLENIKAQNFYETHWFTKRAVIMDKKI